MAAVPSPHEASPNAVVYHLLCTGLCHWTGGSSEAFPEDSQMQVWVCFGSGPFANCPIESEEIVSVKVDHLPVCVVTSTWVHVHVALQSTEWFDVAYKGRVF